MPIDTSTPIDACASRADHAGSPSNAAAAAAALLEAPEPDDSAAAGDWGLFQRRCQYIDGNDAIDQSAALALKRRFGLAYLGGRAQLQGGVYMRARPSVFTPGFVERMAAENAGRRYKRYPWLEQLIKLQEQLDQDQYRTSPQENSLIGSPRRHLHVVPTINSNA